MKNLTILAVFIASILFAANSRAATVEENTREHFALILSAPTVVRSGEDIKIDLKLTNLSKAVIAGGRQVSPDEAELSNGFYVTDPRGRTPTKISYGLAPGDKTDPSSNDRISLSLKTFKVSPGDSMQESCIINRIYDMTAPGQYTIQVQNHLPDGFVVRSNKIIVTVAP